MTFSYHGCIPARIRGTDRKSVSVSDPPSSQADQTLKYILLLFLLLSLVAQGIRETLRFTSVS
jgi:hypothetical protein